jgi:hypothetical protein
VVIDRDTKKELYDLEVEANNEYYARHKAANVYRELEPDSPYDWCVDSLRLDE